MAWEVGGGRWCSMMADNASSSTILVIPRFSTFSFIHIVNDDDDTASSGHSRHDLSKLQPYP